MNAFMKPGRIATPQITRWAPTGPMIVPSSRIHGMARRSEKAVQAKAASKVSANLMRTEM